MGWGSGGIANMGGVPAEKAGTLAQRPAAAPQGTLYFSTDEKKMYRYEGSSWVLYFSSSGSGGTVTSVGLALPASVFNVTGSPVITSGTLTGSFTTQTANRFFAGPTSGAAAVPTFRALDPLDTNGISWNLLGNSGTLPPGAVLGPSLGTQNLFMQAQGLACAQFFGPRAWICGTGHSTPAQNSVIIAGTNNTHVTTANRMFILGGMTNTTSGNGAGIIGGQNSTAGGIWSYIFGSYGNTNANEGAMILGDHVNDPVFSSAANQFMSRFAGGHRFMLSSSLRAMELLPTTGTMVYLNSYSVTAAPTVTLLAGAGTGATFTIQGNNQVGTITITAGSGAAAGDVFSLALSGGVGYPNGSTAVLQPGGNNAATADVGRWACVGSTTGVTANNTIAGVPLVSGQQYIIKYLWMGY